MNTLPINQSWLDWIPGYVFFKPAPTVTQITKYRLEQAKKRLADARLSVVEAAAEAEKQTTILRFLECAP